MSLLRNCSILVALAACGGKKADPSATATPAPRVPSSELPLPEGASKRLGGTSFRLGDSLASIALSNDGKLLATTAGNTIAVWDTATGKRMYLSPGEVGFDRVDQATFAGDALVFAHGARGITVVSTKDWSESSLETCGKEWVEGIAASPDGKTLAVVCENVPELRLQPLDGGAYKAIGTFDASYGAIAWSADATWVALVTLRDNKLHLIDVVDKHVLQGPHLTQHPDALAFAPQGAVLAYDDHETHEHIALYDVMERKEIGAYPLKVSTAAIAFSRDGKHLAYNQVTGKRSLTVIDLPAGTRHELINPTLAIKGLAFADPAGTQLWIGHDHGARLWDLAGDRPLFGAAGHVGEITTLAYRPDGKVLASGGSDDTMRLWIATGKSRLLQVISDEYGVIVIENDDSGNFFQSLSVVTGLGWSRDGATLYETDGRIGSGTLRSWNASTGQQIHAKGLQGVGIKAFALDGKRGFSLGTEEGDDLPVTLRIVDADSAVEEKRIEDLDTGSVAVSHDGTKLAVSASDHVRILDAKTYAELGKVDVDKVESLAFSPDGTQLAVASYWGVAVYKLSGETIDGIGASGWSTAVAWSPDGRLIAGTHEGDVTVYDHGKTTDHEHAHGGEIHTIAVAPDGKSFATGGSDGAILIWPL